MGNVVSLIRTQSSEEEIRNSITDALNLIDFELNGPVRSAAIKVNLCYYWNAATGYTTDPRVVAGIIDSIRERYGMNTDIRVVEADATAMRTKYAFSILEYRKLAKEKNVELFNLSNDSADEKKALVNGREITFKIPQSLLKTDLFVNVPKLKTMRATHITCALKNIFGCIASPRKIVYHPFLNFSIDWIASQIMGYKPSKIGFLKVAMKEKLGSPRGITTRGESVFTFKKIFPKENFFSSARWWSIQVKLLRLYSKIVKDVVPPVLEGI